MERQDEIEEAEDHVDQNWHESKLITKPE